MFSGRSGKGKISSLSPNPRCTAYKVVWKPAISGWLWKVALSCSAFSSSTLPPASYKLPKTHTECPLSEAYCFGHKLRLGYLGTTSLLEAALASLELTAKPKVTSEKLGFHITYLKDFTTPRSGSLLGREEGVSAQQEVEHFEEDDV